MPKGHGYGKKMKSGGRKKASGSGYSKSVGSPKSGNISKGTKKNSVGGGGYYRDDGF
jgi:hypothetical protein